MAAREKENINNQTISASDISDDEQVNSRTTAQTVPRKISAVHEYATKLSPNEYQCKLCSKVKIHLISLEGLPESRRRLDDI